MSMIGLRPARHLVRQAIQPCAWSHKPVQSVWGPCVQQRHLQHSSATTSPLTKTPDFAFAFDIDGVLIRGSKPLPGASAALTSLQGQKIPFLLLTNGGGYHEEKRAQFLSQELQVQIETPMVLQSHTPFQELDELKDRTVLVVGGEHDNCREVAHKYGFKTVVTPSDIFHAYPAIWPFSDPLSFYHTKDSQPQPLPAPINPSNPDKSLKIDAIFVYNDPRDWGLDLTIILDCLLSRQGILGSVSPKNGRFDLINNGYLQDGQPPLYFSNPDLWFAAEFPLPRLGQGGFRAALDGLWSTTTGGAALRKTVLGKPSQDTYEFAEKRLRVLQKDLLPETEAPRLKRVYMIGDNPESDIKGANNYASPWGTLWHSVLVQTGVYDGGEASAEPTVIVEGVEEAVKWALRHAGWSKDGSFN